MKMGNIVPRVGIKPTSLALWASVLTITPSRSHDVTTVPTPTCLCGSLPERSVQAITLLSIYDGNKYINIYTYANILICTTDIYVYIYIYILQTCVSHGEHGDILGQNKISSNHKRLFFHVH